MSVLNIDAKKYDDVIDCSGFYRNKDDDYETSCEKFLCTLAATVDGRIKYCYSCDDGESFVSDNDTCDKCGGKLYSDKLFGLDCITLFDTDEKKLSESMRESRVCFSEHPIDGGFEVSCSMPMFDWGSNGIGLYLCVSSGDITWNLWGNEIYIIDEDGNVVYTCSTYEPDMSPKWIEDLSVTITDEAIKYIKNWASNIDNIMEEFKK